MLVARAMRPIAAIEVKNIGAPDETRTFDHGQLKVVTLSGLRQGHVEPGWRWSTSVKPIAETDSFQVLWVPGTCRVPERGNAL